MFKNLTKKALVATATFGVLAMPVSLLANASSAMGGSSESTSALIEKPNVETQLNKINVGINVVRTNSIILSDMPISQDSQWVDEVTADITSERRQEILNHPIVKNDPYYSTVAISNAFLGQSITIAVSPLGYSLYNRVLVLYKNETNQENGGKYKLPNLNAMPSIFDIQTFVTFPDEKGVELINVEATTGTLHKNAEAATIALCPEDMQESLTEAKNEYKTKLMEKQDKEAEVKAIEAWIDDDKNSKAPEMEEKKASLEIKELELEEAEEAATVAEDIYGELLEEAALALESNFDETKVPLAKKLDKLYLAIDQGAIEAISLLGVATLHLTKNGLGSLGNELRAIGAAQAVSSLVGNQKQFLALRYERLAKNALYAIPNVAIGTYQASKQSFLAGKYQKIVETVLEGHEAMLESQEEMNKAEK